MSLKFNQVGTKINPKNMVNFNMTIFQKRLRNQCFSGMAIRSKYHQKIDPKLDSEMAFFFKSQISGRRVPGRCHKLSRRRKMVPRHSKMRPKTAPRRPQEAPKTPPRATQDPVPPGPMGCLIFGRQGPVGYFIFGRQRPIGYPSFGWHGSMGYAIFGCF